MTTLSQVKQGTTLPKPIYKHKPYLVLSKEDVVLSAGTLDEIKALSDYYDECTVDIRRHDLDQNDNSKIVPDYDVLHRFGSKIHVTKIKGVWFELIRRKVGEIRAPGIGVIPTMENTGRFNRKRITINTGHIITIPAEKKEVDRWYRKLRPEEKEKLRKIDQQIYELKLAREVVLQEAWEKGHTITVKELIEAAEAEVK